LSPEAAPGGVRVENLTVRYGETVAVDGVSLDVRPGEFFFLLGPSGCGKTSLLRAIAGLEPAAAGSVHIGGRDVTVLPPYKRGAPMVFQGYALWPHMTLLENTAYGLEAAGRPGGEARARALESLRLVGLEDRAGSRPAELSGGQQQRVALARALAAGPDVVLLDEPLSNLDAKLRREMRGELVRLHRDAGFTAIYVTHDQEEALSMAQRLALMQEGRVVELGEPRELYGGPSTRFGAEFLGEVNWLKVESLREGSAGHVLVKTSLGEVSVREPEQPAARYLLGFRPERARVGDASGEVLRVQGKVRTVSFLGGEERLTLELADGQELVLRIEAVGARPGSRLVGYVDARDVWLLPSDQGSGTGDR
jgi:ABC-type Fe3+/spermidine/putrescine transport system ATPase subunit